MRATINPRRRVPGLPRTRVRASFLGLSYEYRMVEFLTGNSVTGPNIAAEGLLRHLAAGGARTPTLRVGGGSTDDGYWNPAHLRPHPPGLSVDITEDMLGGLASLTRRTRAPLILGLNLANPRLSSALTWMNVARKRLGGSIKAFELGNEPDIFTVRGYGVDSRGRLVHARPKGWGPPDLLREFAARAKALRKVARVPLAGPALCCLDRYLRYLPRFLRHERRLVRLATIHSYGGAACPGIRRNNADFVSVRGLLSQKRLARKLGVILGGVQAARQVHKRLRVTEVNSAACGGKPGVSDRFAAGLWGADLALGMATFGALGADFHTSGIYTPVDFYYDPGAGWRGYAKPLYYGMLLAARALPAGARVLPAATYGARRRPGANVTLWATLDRHRTLRVVVVNKDLRARGSVRLRIRGGRGRGHLLRLVAPGVRSRRGVTFAGQHVPDGTLTGALTGRSRVGKVRRRHGAYSFGMRPASAAVLEVRVRR